MRFLISKSKSIFYSLIYLMIQHVSVLFPIRHIVLFFLLLISSLFFYMEPADAQSAPGIPTLVVPSAQKLFQTTHQKPLLRGLTQNNTRVAVYINDTFYGYAEVKNANNGTASFAYIPFLHLKPGFHYAQVRAQWPDGSRQSALSTRIDFEVLKAFPAPTLMKPVVNTRTTSVQPWIVGLTWVPARIRIFIDGNLNGEIEVTSKNQKKITDFAYKPFLPLEAGKNHSVYATAVDTSGKASAFSRVENFYLPLAQKAAVQADITVTEQAGKQDKDGETPKAPSEVQIDTIQTEEATDTKETQEKQQELEETLESEAPSSTVETPASVEQNTNSTTAVKATEENEEKNESETEAANLQNKNTEVSETSTSSPETTIAADTSSQKPNRLWMLWLVIALVILVILFRRRGVMQMSEQKQKDIASPSPSPSSTTTPQSTQKSLETQSKEGKSNAVEGESTAGKPKDEELPPPPPPASGY